MARVKEVMYRQLEAMGTMWQVEFKDRTTGRAVMWVP